jgi:site-specific DNA recombinase
MPYATEPAAQTISNQAVIYIRVSSERQVGNASLETQERACLDLCARNHWEVLQVFREEGESAKTANRTEFQKALMYCRRTNPRPRYFVVYHTDRFARNAMDHDAVRQTLLNWGVLLRSVCQQLGEKPMDRFIERIWSGQAELDNEIRKEKTLGGMNTRLRQGNWTFKAPLGYKNEKRGGIKTIVPDPERAPLIREAFERYATGLHKRQTVLEWVNDKGLRTWQGKRLSTETFRRMLGNPLFAGRIIVQGKKGGAGQDWRVIEKGNFEAIVPEETFDKVQALLAGRRPTLAPRRRANPDFPLRHFVRCGCCEKPLTGSKSTSRTGEKYAYYHCQNRNCVSQVRVSTQQMESEFNAFMRELKPNSDYLPVFRESVIAVYEKKFAESLDLRDALERDLRQKRDAKRKLNEAFIYRNAISDGDYRQMKEALEQEILALEMKVNEAKQEEIEIEQLLDFSENLLLNAAGTWSESSLEQKQRLQQILFPQGVTYADGFYRTRPTRTTSLGIRTARNRFIRRGSEAFHESHRIIP